MRIVFPRPDHPMPSSAVTRDIIVGGKRVDGGVESAPVGIYDDIRRDVREMSSVQPVEKVQLERTKLGYRGVLYSKGKPYLFAMVSTGFSIKPVDSEDAQLFTYCDRLADEEAKLTLQRKEALYLREQQADEDAPFLEPMSDEYARSGPMVDHGAERRIEPKPLLLRQKTHWPSGTSAGGVILRDGKVAVVKPRNGYGGYDWTWPKGGLEDYECAVENGAELAAQREVFEETGLTCRAVKHLGHVKYDDGGVCHFYLMQVAEDGDKTKVDGFEIERLKWVSFIDAMELLNNDHDIQVLSWANTAYPKLVLKSYEDDLIKADKHTGLMIAFYLDKDLAASLAHDGGEAADSLHITLAYLGKGHSKETIKKVREVVKHLAEVTPKVNVTLGGVGRFSASATSEGRDVFYLSVDSAELTAFRQLLVDKLAEEGIGISTVHGFVPHVTLKYIDPKEPLPVKRFEPVTTVFTDVSVVAAEDRTTYRLERSKARLKKADHQTAYRRKDPRTGKMVFVKQRGVQPSLGPAAMKPRSRVLAEKQEREAAAKAPRKKAAVVDWAPENITLKPTWVVNEDKMTKVKRVTKTGLLFYKLSCPYKAKGNDHVPGTKIEQEDAHFFFTMLKSDEYDSFDDIVYKFIKRYWVDEGDGKFTEAKARQQLYDMCKLFENDGLIYPGWETYLIKRDLPAAQRKQLDLLRHAAAALHGANDVAETSNEDKAESKRLAGRKFRGLVRELLAAYGKTFDSYTAGANPVRIVTKAKLRDLARSSRAGALHLWDGTVVTSDKHWASACVDFLCAASPELMNANDHQPDVLRMFLHEELHGFSNQEPSSYRGIGILIEEVTTEVTARVATRALPVYANKDISAKVPASFKLSGFGGVTGGSYGMYITAMQLAVAQTFPELSVDAQNKLLEDLCVSYKKRMAGTKITSPQELLQHFVQGVPFNANSPGDRQHLKDGIMAIAAKLANEIHGGTLLKGEKLPDSVFDLDRNDLKSALALRARRLKEGKWTAEEEEIIVMLQDDATEVLRAIGYVDDKPLMVKALPRKSSAQKDSEQKKDTSPIGASTKRAGAGGKTRYSYTGENGGQKKPGADKKAPKAPKDGGKPEKQTQAQAFEEETPEPNNQKPILVPKPNRQHHDPQPQHTVDLEPLIRQLGTTKQILQRIAKRFATNKKLGGRSGFVEWMQTNLKGFAQKFHLDDDYFGLVYDVLTGAVAPPAAEAQGKPPAA